MHERFPGQSEKNLDTGTNRQNPGRSRETRDGWQVCHKGARDAWAETFGDTLSTICRDPSDLDSWHKFFMLCSCILASPARGGRRSWRETVKLVKSRLRQWQAGDIQELWSDVLVAEDKLSRQWKKPNKAPQETLQRTNARRARSAVEEGQYRKVIQALCSEGLAPPSTAFLEEMLAKHPQVSPPQIPLDPVPLSADISEGDVLRALKSFSGGSAPGPSGCRANHLKEAVLCPSPDHSAFALRALTEIVKLLCAGDTPAEVVPYLCGASLLACQKKGGGLRPIAVGEVLRRLSSKCLSRAVQRDAFRSLTPLQVGVGVKTGCEAIVHSVTRTLEDPNIQPEECWTLLLDFSNAFNSIPHGRMFEEVRARLPSIAAWMESCYGAQPILYPLSSARVASSWEILSAL